MWQENNVLRENILDFCRIIYSGFFLCYSTFYITVCRALILKITGLFLTWWCCGPKRYGPKWWSGGGGEIPSSGWMGGMAGITSSLIILARSFPISMSNQENQHSPYAHSHTHARTHTQTNTQALQKAHLRNCRCRRDTAHRRKRRALRKSPSASRRPPRRRWGRMGSRSTTSPPLPQGS